MKRFFERRSGRDRRDWETFFYPNRRSGNNRRCGGDRRVARQEYAIESERRRSEIVATQSPPPQSVRGVFTNHKEYYSTAEVVERTGLSQTTLLLWVRNKLIDGSHIKRSVEGKRLWTRENIEEIERLKSRNGWAR